HHDERARQISAVQLGGTEKAKRRLRPQVQLRRPFNQGRNKELGYIVRQRSCIQRNDVERVKPLSLLPQRRRNSILKAVLARAFVEIRRSRKLVDPPPPPDSSGRGHFLLGHSQPPFMRKLR